MTTTKENKARNTVISAANYLSGSADETVTFRTTKALAQFVQLAASAHSEAEAQAEKLAGGVRGLLVVALLVVSRTEKLGKGDAAGGTIGQARDWLRNHGVFPDTQDGKQTNLWSECAKVAETFAAWQPAIPDVATATQEAMARVREALAKPGGFKALRDAAPRKSNAGRKKGQGAGKSTKAKTEVVTAREANLRAIKYAKALGVFAAKGDAEALDDLKTLAKVVSDAIASATAAKPVAKTQRKAA